LVRRLRASLLPRLSYFAFWIAMAW
jgi:hypothetical protein